MRWPFKSLDYLYLLIFLWIFYDLFSTWSEYSTCYAPIQIFLLLTYIFCILFRLYLTVIIAPDLPRTAKKLLIILFHWVLYPFSLYLVTQGIIWKIQIDIHSPLCTPPDRAPYVIWVWIGLDAFLSMIMTIMTITKLIFWVKVCLFRRRYQRIFNQGDHNALNQLLLEDETLNSRIALLPSDLERLPTTIYTEGLSDLLKLDHQSSCPICYEEFVTGDQVITLPGCNHIYNGNCIKGWLERSPLCPMCRANVRTNLHHPPQSSNGEDLQQVCVRENYEKGQEDLENQRLV